MKKPVSLFAFSCLCGVLFCAVAHAQTIFVSVSPSVGGDVVITNLTDSTGAGPGTTISLPNNDSGDAVQLFAFPANGYTLTAWDESGTEASTANPFNFIADGNSKFYTAVFEIQAEPSDTDEDGLSDTEEQNGPANGNPGGINGVANFAPTNPGIVDTDGDGMNDGWEVFYGLDPNDATGDNGAFGDPDNDGLNNFEEYVGADGEEPSNEGLNTDSTDPQDADTDGDGLGDKWEVDFELDPLVITEPNGTNHNEDGDLLPSVAGFLYPEVPLGSDGYVPGITTPFVNILEYAGFDGVRGGNVQQLGIPIFSSVTNNTIGSAELEVLGTGASITTDSYSATYDAGAEEWTVVNETTTTTIGTIAAAPDAGGSLDVDAPDGFTVTVNPPSFGVYNTGDRFEWTNTFTVNDDPGTDPKDPDSDDDTLPDGWEYYFYGNAIRFGITGRAYDPSTVTGSLLITTSDILSAFNPVLQNSASQEDTDLDCLTNAEELAAGTSPIDWDTDGDGMPDGWELDNGLNPLEANDADENPDNDWMAEDLDTPDPTIIHGNVYAAFAYDPRTGWNQNYQDKQGDDTAQPNTVELTSLKEFQAAAYQVQIGTVMSIPCEDLNLYATDPNTPDSDADGMPDGWELYVGLNPVDSDDAAENADSDELLNNEEFSSQQPAIYDPTNFPVLNTQWLNKFWPTDPNDPDTDGDQVQDHQEFTFVYEGGTPGPGLVAGGGLNPTSVDTDTDYLPDGWEFFFAASELSITNRNGMDGTVADATGLDNDYDGDGLENYQEYMVSAIYHWQYDQWTPGLGLGGYDPFDFFDDTMLGLKPFDWDWNFFVNADLGVEFYFIQAFPRPGPELEYSSTDPRDDDSDADGMDDYYEIFHGLNPLFGTWDIVASGYINQFKTPIPTFDVRLAPYVIGDALSDSDQDGLPNTDESITTTLTDPSFYHTDPTPLWVTDISYELSFANLYYALESMLNWWGDINGLLSPPAYWFDFEANEGFDTDNDNLADTDELVDASSPGFTSALDPEDPIKRRALYLNGDAAARTKGRFFHAPSLLDTFTVEVWARPMNPVSGSRQILVEKPVDITEGNIQDLGSIQLNFRVGLEADGRPFAEYTGSGDSPVFVNALAPGAEVLVADEWAHLAATYDGQALKLYRDGNLVATTPSGKRPANGWVEGQVGIFFSSPIVVGAQDNNPIAGLGESPILQGGNAGFFPGLTGPGVNPILVNQFEGWVDEIRIWDGAADEATIQANMMKRLKRTDIQEAIDAAAASTTLPTPLYHYSFDALPDPDHSPIVPPGFSLLNGRPNDGSYPGIPWLRTEPLRSQVYNDYLFVQWIENTVAHLPQDPPPDSPSSSNAGAPIEFPNDSNPYGFAYYTGMSKFTEKHPSYGTQDPFFPVLSPLFNDLVPLRFAVADEDVDMWDNGGTGVSPFDTDGDGIPDDWETANGLDPLDPTDAILDNDNDGVSNLNEYRIGTDPGNVDTDGDGIFDGAEDADGDGLSNAEENQEGTRPDKTDTDDDGLPDNVELSSGFSPVDSLNPFTFRNLSYGDMLVFNGEVIAPDVVNGVETERLSLPEFTLELYARADVIPQAGEVVLLSRTVEATGQLNYEMGLTAAGMPFVRYEQNNGSADIQISSTSAVPANVWVHLSATYDGTSLRLYVDAQSVASTSTFVDPAVGAGDLQIGGIGYDGDLKEIRIWNRALTQTELENNRCTALYSETDSDVGILRTDGGTGHLRQNATTDNPATGEPIDHLRLWTIEGWIRTTDSDGTVIARWNSSNGGEENNYNYFLGVSADGSLLGRFTLFYELQEDPDSDDVQEILNRDANNINGAIPVNDGQWHHVAYVRSATEARLYVDGILDGVQARTLLPLEDVSEAMNISVNQLEGPVVVGRNLTADMDEIRIWNRALPIEEIADISSRNLTGNEEGLITYFNFDRQTGATADERATVRDPDNEFGVYIPNAVHVSGPNAPISVEPLLSLFSELRAYFPADDGGDTLEDFRFEGDEDYAGIFSGDVNFQVLASHSLPCDGDFGGSSVSIPDCGLDQVLDTQLQSPWVLGVLNSSGNPVNQPQKEWQCQGNEVNTGDFALQAGGLTNSNFTVLNDNETTYIETDVYGPGTVCFAWNASVEPPVQAEEADYLNFRVNGALVDRITGTNLNWSSECIDIPSGLQTLRWEYKKDSVGFLGQDAVWLDDLQFTHTGVDSDGDGLSDAYETGIYGTDPNLVDTDGDMVSDADEVALGTDPLTPDVPVAFSISVVGGQIQVEWMGTSGFTYQIQKSYDMQTWIDAPSGFLPIEQSLRTVAITGLVQYIDPVSPESPAPAYRIIVVP